MSVEPNEDNLLTRRDFLKGRWRNESRPKDILLEYLGTTNVNLDFKFGSHYFTDDLSYILKRDIDIICGETGSGIAWRLCSPESIEETDWERVLKEPFRSGTASQLKQHRKSITELFEKGITFALTDFTGTTSEFSKLESDIPESVFVLGYLALVSTSSYLLQKGFKGKEKAGAAAKGFGEKKDYSGITRREFLKILATALGMGVAGVPFILKTYADEDLIIEANKMVKEPDFITTWEAVTKFRDKMMALNSWHTIANSAAYDRKINVLFTGGLGHLKAKDQFMKGPCVLEEEVEQYAQRLCTSTLDLLIREWSANKEEVSDLLAIYGNFFVQPTQIGKKVYDHWPISKAVPRSARAVLVERMIVAIEENFGQHRIKPSKTDYKNKAEILELALFKLTNQQFEDTLNLESSLIERFNVFRWFPLGIDLECSSHHTVSPEIDISRKGYAHLSGVFVNRRDGRAYPELTAAYQVSLDDPEQESSKIDVRHYIQSPRSTNLLPGFRSNDYSLIKNDSWRNNNYYRGRETLRALIVGQEPQDKSEPLQGTVGILTPDDPIIPRSSGFYTYAGPAYQKNLPFDVVLV